MALTEVDPALRSEPARPRASRAAAQLDLRKITTPILLHLLRGKIRFPRLFLVKCKLTVNRFKKTIDPRFPAEMVDMCALPLWVYINLKRELGQKTRIRDHARRDSHRRRRTMEFRLSRRRGGSHLQKPLRRRDHRQSEWPNALEHAGGGRADRTAVRDQDHAMPLPRTHDGDGNSRADAGY